MAPFSQDEKHLSEGMSDHLYTSLRQLRQAVESLWADDTPKIIRDYTDHGVKHMERVAGWAQKLRQGNYGEELSENERYLLLAGIYMHDIGMQCDVQKFPQIKKRAEAKDLGAKFDVAFTAQTANQYSTDEQMAIRNNHHLLSAAWISEARGTENIPLGLAIKGIPYDLVEDLMHVCMYHTKLSILDCPIEFDHDPTGRKQLVAALLRFADELDIDSRRVNIQTVLAFSLDPQNSVHWWFHENIRVFLENGRVTIRTLLHPDDFKEYEPLAYDNSIGRFQRKNKLVMDVLNWYRHPAWISYMSKVVEASYSLKLPVEITEVLDEMKAPRKPREEREATNQLKNADRLVKDLRELDNRWYAIMLELHSFDSSWPQERRDYVSSRPLPLPTKLIKYHSSESCSSDTASLIS